MVLSYDPKHLPLPIMALKLYQIHVELKSLKHIKYVNYIMPLLRVLGEKQIKEALLRNVYTKLIQRFNSNSIDELIPDNDFDLAYNNIVEILDITIEHGFEKEDLEKLNLCFKAKLLGDKSDLKVLLEKGVVHFFQQLDQEKIKLVPKPAEPKKNPHSTLSILGEEEDVTVVQNRQNKITPLIFNTKPLAEGDELVIINHNQSEPTCPYTLEPLGDLYVTNKACGHQYSCKGAAALAIKKNPKCPLIGCNNSIVLSQLLCPDNIQLCPTMDKKQLSEKLLGLISRSKDPIIKEIFESIKKLINEEIKLFYESTKHIMSIKKILIFPDDESLRSFISELIDQMKSRCLERYSKIQKALKK